MQVRFRNGLPVITNADDAEICVIYLFSQNKSPHTWKDIFEFRASLCENLQELLLADEYNHASLTKNIQQSIEIVWPVDRAIYSTETCPSCHNKTIYYVSPQISSSDEEQAFFAICTMCNREV